MNNTIKVFFLAVLIVVLSNCKRDKVTWYPEFAVPVAHGALNFSDFQNTDIFNLDGEVVSVHYYDTLTPLDLTELIDLGDTVLSASYSPGFAFGPIPFSNGISIYSLVEDYSFNLDGALLRSGKVKSGSLRVTFESDVQGYLDLSYVLEGVQLDGVPLEVSGQTLPASSETPYVDELIVDISGYELDFTGSTGIERNVLVGELDVSTSEEPTYTAQVYGDDEVTVKIELLDLEVDELRGYFGQWDKNIDEEIVLDSVLYQSGNFTLSEIDASLEFINNFGVDVQVEIDELTALNNVYSQEVVLEAGGLNDLHDISRAIETPDGVLSSSVIFNFDESSNLAEAISITPHRFRLLGDAILNPLGDITGGFDFYLSEFPFQVVTDISFPLCLGFENFTLADTLEFSLDQTEEIAAVKLTAYISNSFPVGLEFKISSIGENEPFWTGIISAAPEDTTVDEKMELEISSSRLEKLQLTEKIYVEVVANTTEYEEVKLLTSDKLELLITAEITYEAEF